MAVKRLSPGVYEVNGKRVNAKTEADALRMAGGGGSSKQKSGGAKASSGGSGILPKGTKIKDAPSAIEAEQKVETYQAQQGLGFANPNVSGPFGGRKAQYDAQGNIIGFEDYLSPEGEKIRQQDDTLTQYGRDMAMQLANTYNIGGGFNPELAQRTTTGDLNTDRQRMEEEVFGRLTRTTEADRNRDVEAKKQELYNQGIPYSDDPNSRFQKELGDINKRYDTLKADARAQATQFGGGELERSFGINEQLIANQLSQQQGIRNQQIGELVSFADFGQGLRAPDLGAVQGVDYSLMSPTEAQLALKQQKLEEQALNKASARAGGGGGGAPPTQSPFNTNLPPGIGINAQAQQPRMQGQPPGIAGQARAGSNVVPPGLRQQSTQMYGTYPPPGQSPSYKYGAGKRMIQYG